MSGSHLSFLQKCFFRFCMMASTSEQIKRIWLLLDMRLRRYKKRFVIPYEFFCLFVLNGNDSQYNIETVSQQFIIKFQRLQICSRIWYQTQLCEGVQILTCIYCYFRKLWPIAFQLMISYHVVQMGNSTHTLMYIYCMYVLYSTWHMHIPVRAFSLQSDSRFC